LYNVKNTTAQRPFLDFGAMAVSTEQDRQCTYNVTWGAFVQPLLLWISHKYYIFQACVCSLTYPVCN